MEERRILVGISGGIAAYKAPELVRALRRAGHAVRCVMTPAARAFVACYGEDSIVVVGSRLRLVVAIDVSRADVAPVPDAHPAAVTLTGRVMSESIACIFLDEADAADDARAAAGGDEVALERLEERDLLWYDVSEMGQLPV